ncbi:hypothetical protein ACLOJK_018138 [Asimina triloba]
MSCLRPSSCKHTVRESEDGGGPFHQRKLSHGELEEPNSPKVGCMGQIKIRNRGSKDHQYHHKFFKLKKMLSGKNVTLSRGISQKLESRDYGVIRIVELDPPLPVPKAAVKDCSNAVSLWKRRCGHHHPLESLQLQPQRPRLPPQLQQLRLQDPKSQQQQQQ